MRLLVATEFSPNASGGGPAVVRQMLKNFPDEHLFWWSAFSDVPNRFGRGVQKHFCATIPTRLYPQRRFTSIKSAFLDYVWSPWAAAHLRRTIYEIKPDAVWVIPHDWSIPPLAKALLEDQLPYHITVQDYVDVHRNPQRFGASRCTRMARAADQLYAQAFTRDATSHPMIADIQARTGKQASQMLHAGLEAADFEFLKSKQAGNSNSIRIAYAGTILVEAVFELFVKAVEKIRKSVARPLELHLYGAHSYANREWFNRDWMAEHGNLREPELLAALRECDWGFAPMSLVDDDPRYNRFSFPTKLITYLAAGLPTIVLAHPESSVMKMVTQYCVGFRSSVSDVESLGAELSLVFNGGSPWEQFGSEIQRCARAEFDAERMRRRLYECFEACAQARLLLRADE